MYRKVHLLIMHVISIQVVDFRSADPRRTEKAFAEWLVSEKENKPRMYEFWAKLFLVCYERGVDEIAQEG